MKKTLKVLFGSLILVTVLVGVFSLLGFATPLKAQQAVPNLGTAGDFSVLAKTDLWASPDSTAFILGGNVGVNIAESAIQVGNFGNGFRPFTRNTAGTRSSSNIASGEILTTSYNSPTPTILANAVRDMEAAYTAIAALTPTHTETNGNLSNRRLTPGIYKWDTNVSVSAGRDLTLVGDENDVFIFRIGTVSSPTTRQLAITAGSEIILEGGVRPQNVFWQVHGGVTLGDNATFQGILLASRGVTLNNNSTFNGKIFTQSWVNLYAQSNVINVTAATSGNRDDGPELDLIPVDNILQVSTSKLCTSNSNELGILNASASGTTTCQACVPSSTRPGILVNPANADQACNTNPSVVCAPTAQASPVLSPTPICIPCFASANDPTIFVSSADPSVICPLTTTQETTIETNGACVPSNDGSGQLVSSVNPNQLCSTIALVTEPVTPEPIVRIPPSCSPSSPTININDPVIFTATGGTVNGVFPTGSYYVWHGSGFPNRVIGPEFETRYSTEGEKVVYVVVVNDSPDTISSQSGPQTGSCIVNVVNTPEPPPRCLSDTNGDGVCNCHDNNSCGTVSSDDIVCLPRTEQRIAPGKSVSFTASGDTNGPRYWTAEDGQPNTAELAEGETFTTFYPIGTSLGPKHVEVSVGNRHSECRLRLESAVVITEEREEVPQLPTTGFDPSNRSTLIRSALIALGAIIILLALYFIFRTSPQAEDNMHSLDV